MIESIINMGVAIKYCWKCDKKIRRFRKIKDGKGISRIVCYTCYLKNINAVFYKSIRFKDKWHVYDEPEESIPQINTRRFYKICWNCHKKFKPITKYRTLCQSCYAILHDWRNNGIRHPKPKTERFK